MGGKVAITGHTLSIERISFTDSLLHTQITSVEWSIDYIQYSYILYHKILKVEIVSVCMCYIKSWKKYFHFISFA